MISAISCMVRSTEVSGRATYTLPLSGPELTIAMTRQRFSAESSTVKGRPPRCRICSSVRSGNCTETFPVP